MLQRRIWLPFLVLAGDGCGIARDCGVVRERWLVLPRRVPFLSRRVPFFVMFAASLRARSFFSHRVPSCTFLPSR